jgi:predicted NBD/HSP70 family sugar kinase
MERKRTTGRDIRRQNRSALLSELFFHGPLSRLELAELTGLSPATASNVTAELIAERLIVEAGQVESDGGRPRVLLRVDPEYGYVIGVVVDETGILVELFDLAMTRRAAVVEPLTSLDAASVADLIAEGIREVITRTGLTPDDVVGIGVAVPGIVEQGISALVHAPTIGWYAVPLTQLLRERGVTLPIFVENGAKTFGQAEMWFGAGRGARHAVIVLIGTGVGGALVTDGASYRGVSSSAGEWGHTTIMYGGRVCRCGAQGCLEAYIGAEGILDRWKKARGGRQLPEGDPISQLQALLSSADRSKVSSDLLDETADLIGAGIANLINLFNPERVVLGGWAGLELGGRLLPRIREAAGRSALAHLYEQASIELSTLGQGAVALGAATQPVAALLAGTTARAEAKMGGRQRADIDVA